MKALTIAAVILLTLLLGEVIVRIIAPQDRNGLLFTVSDPWGYTILKSNVKVYTKREVAEDIIFSINTIYAAEI